MHPELRTHTLLRIAGARSLLSGSPSPASSHRPAHDQAPSWVEQALMRAPWVVMRRECPTDATVPVGVRGAQRHERFAAWLPRSEILERITPESLVQRRAWVAAARRERIAALAVLDEVAEILRAHGLDEVWGPAGSVGFELATGYPAAHSNSDLDLAVQLPAVPCVALTRSLHGQLAKLAARCDVLLETPAGALALAEHAQGHGSFVLRTPQGPCLHRAR